jgi:hypothetical protein
MEYDRVLHDRVHVRDLGVYLPQPETAAVQG